MERVEFPIFTGDGGDDLRQWIDSMEYEFLWYGFTDLEKLNLEQAVIEGEAIVWFYHRQRFLLFRNWDALKNALLLRFGDNNDLEKIRLQDNNKRFLEKCHQNQEQIDAVNIQEEKALLPSVETVHEETSESMTIGDGGDDLRQWIDSMEYEFLWYGFTDLEKLNLAQAVIEGEAIVWFYHRQRFLLFRNWDALKNALLLRFGDNNDLEKIRLQDNNKRFLEKCHQNQEQIDAVNIQDFGTYQNEI